MWFYSLLHRTGSCVRGQRTRLIEVFRRDSSISANCLSTARTIRRGIPPENEKHGRWPRLTRSREVSEKGVWSRAGSPGLRAERGVGRPISSRHVQGHPRARLNAVAGLCRRSRLCFNGGPPRFEAQVPAGLGLGRPGRRADRGNYRWLRPARRGLTYGPAESCRRTVSLKGLPSSLARRQKVA